MSSDCPQEAEKDPQQPAIARPQSDLGGADAAEPNADAPPERVDVTAMHAPIMREKKEPRDGYEPVPMWLIAAAGALLFWGGWYLSNYSGGWKADVLDERPQARFGTAEPRNMQPPDPMALGKQLYSGNCVSCHQADGKGIPGAYPPLAGSEWVIGEPYRLRRILLQGLEGALTVSGSTYYGSMPAFAQKFTDDELAALLTYVRASWNNNAPAVSAQSVAATREKTRDRTGPWNEAALRAVISDDLAEGSAGAAATQALAEPASQR